MQKIFGICLALSVTLTISGQEESPSEKEMLTQSMITLIQAKMKSLSATDKLYQKAQKGYQDHNQDAQELDDAATEFIACLTQEIHIEFFTTQLIAEYSSLSEQLLQEIYEIIPPRYKKNTIHRSNIILINKVIDGISHADYETLTLLFNFIQHKITPDTIT
jgi:hypothetical protein